MRAWCASGPTGTDVPVYAAEVHGADMVFKSGVPITVIPLDVAHKMLISPDGIARLRKLYNQAGKIAADILDAYVEHDIINSTDCLVVRCTRRPPSSYLLRPELFNGHTVNVEVDTREGRTFG